MLPPGTSSGLSLERRVEYVDLLPEQEAHPSPCSGRRAPAQARIVTALFERATGGAPENFATSSGRCQQPEGSGFPGCGYHLDRGGPCFPAKLLRDCCHNSRTTAGTYRGSIQIIGADYGGSRDVSAGKLSSPWCDRQRQDRDISPSSGGGFETRTRRIVLVPEIALTADAGAFVHRFGHRVAISAD